MVMKNMTLPRTYNMTASIKYGIHQRYTCLTSTTSIHWCLYRYTSCRWLEALTGTSTENLASTGGRGHQCLPIRNPGPLVVEIATTLSWSSAAV